MPSELLARSEGQSAPDDEVKWHNALPPDLNRAAGEIYVTIRSSGASTMRDYVDRMFTSADARASQKFQELFAGATMVDFEVSRAKSETDKLKILNTSDALEIYMRQLAAYVHMRRTGDAEAASHMLAVRAPGADTDIAPGWLVQSSSVHSKLEYQSKERSGARGWKQSAASPKKKGGKGGKGSKGGAAAAAPG
jgi:hypothetical protein